MAKSDPEKAPKKPLTHDEANPALSDPTATHAASVPADDASDWPEPASAPGDEVRVAGILESVGQVTDVGSLAKVLRAVVAQCRKSRVRPAVVAEALK